MSLHEADWLVKCNQKLPLQKTHVDLSHVKHYYTGEIALKVCSLAKSSVLSQAAVSDSTLSRKKQTAEVRERLYFSLVLSLLSSYTNPGRLTSGVSAEKAPVIKTKYF